MNFPKWFLFFWFFIIPAAASAQYDPFLGPSKDNDSAWIEIGGLYSTNSSRTPFWHQTNQWGIVPRQGNGVLLRAGFQGQFYLQDRENGLRVALGAEGAENITTEPQFVLPQAYGGLRLGNWELFVGRKRQTAGLGDSSLGTGAFVMSGNAIPAARVQLGTTQFTDLPFTNGWLRYNVSYSDGYFDKDRPTTSDLKLHQKQLYLSIGNPDGWLKLYGGFNHQVQWGGRTPYIEGGQMPSTFQDYLNMIIGKRGPQVSIPNAHDQENRIGNHLGSIDLAFEIDGINTNWFVYRQSFYEDGGLIVGNNIADGLNGIRIRKKEAIGSNFELLEGVIEVLYTKSQGGNLWSNSDASIRGKDNYFNHAQVRDGWSFKDRTIGTPFITPTSDTRWNYFIYGDSYTSNNRVFAAHLGLKGTILENLQWYTKLTYSNNSGIYLDNGETSIYPSVNQFSGLFTLQNRMEWLGGTTIRASVAADVGDLYPQAWGFMLSLRKDNLF